MYLMSQVETPANFTCRLMHKPDKYLHINPSIINTILPLSINYEHGQFLTRVSSINSTNNSDF